MLNKICLVCGDPKAAKHYGSFCCSGCKGFFRRSIRGNAQYYCSFKSECKVQQVFRNSCKACRLKKCLEVGMHPMLVHDDRKLYKRRKKKELLNQTEELASPSSPPTTLLPSISDSSTSTALNAVVKVEKHKIKQHLYSDAWLELAIKANKQLWIPNSIALGKAKIIPQFDINDSFSITNYYVLVEKLVDDFYDTDLNHVIDKLECTLELGVEDAFENPRKMSPRTKIDWKGREILQSGGLNNIYCRLFLHYIDWASHIPEMNEISDQDWNQLLFSRSVTCLWMMLCQRSIMYKTDGISLGGGIYFPMNEKEQAKVDKNALPFLKKICCLLMEEFIEPAKAINLTESEYAILRVLCFFTAEIKLSPKGREIVRKARNFYRNILVEHLRLKNAADEFSIATRVSELLSLLPILEIASRMANDEFCFMTLFNVAEMQGKLTYDLYVRKSL